MTAARGTEACRAALVRHSAPTPVTRPCLACLLLLAAGGLAPLAAAQVRAPAATFVGTVVDAETGEALPGATALVLGEAGGTVSNRDGSFRLMLSALPATVVVRFVGFATARSVVAAGDVQGGVVRRTVRLAAERGRLGEAVVTGEPPGERLWRRVLARRAALAARVGAYAAEAYTRLLLVRRGRLDVGEVPIQLTETLSNLSWRAGRDGSGLREEVVARRRLPAGGPFRWAAPGPVPDLYLDDVLALDGRAVPSPFAADALDHYAFRLGETADSAGVRFLDVAVVPRRGGLVAGRIRIVDTLLVVAEAELRADGGRPAGADLFDATYRWTFAPVWTDALRDSLWLPALFTREGSVTVNLPGYRIPTVRFRQRSALTLVVPGVPGEAARLGRRYGSAAGVYGGREVYALGRRTLPLDSLERAVDSEPRFRRMRLAEMLPPQEGIGLSLFGLERLARPDLEGEDE